MGNITSRRRRSRRRNRQTQQQEQQSPPTTTTPPSRRTPPAPLPLDLALLNLQLNRSEENSGPTNPSNRSELANLSSEDMLHYLILQSNLSREEQSDNFVSSPLRPLIQALMTQALHERMLRASPEIIEGYTQLFVIDDLEKNLPNEEQKSCVCCFESFKLKDEVRRLPCLHLFHKGCIDPWLQDKGNCPMCKRHIRNLKFEGDDDD
mmetsp:Transcript_10612/g.15543  ORF Transcript_10612/g.15543 Transcript_10612/m.15543 type:complete len:207 (-) Transcript_10612:58-678(-)